MESSAAPNLVSYAMPSKANHEYSNIALANSLNKWRTNITGKHIEMDSSAAPNLVSNRAFVKSKTTNVKSNTAIGEAFAMPNTAVYEDSNTAMVDSLSEKENELRSDGDKNPINFVDNSHISIGAMKHKELNSSTVSNIVSDSNTACVNTTNEKSNTVNYDANASDCEDSESGYEHSNIAIDVSSRKPEMMASNAAPSATPKIDSNAAITESLTSNVRKGEVNVECNMNCAGSVPSNAVRLVSNIASNITYIRLPRNEHDLATDEIANRNINTLRNGLDCEETGNTTIINNDIQEQRFSIPWHQDQFDDHNNALTRDVYHHNKKRGTTTTKLKATTTQVKETLINK